MIKPQTAAAVQNDQYPETGGGRRGQDSDRRNAIIDCAEEVFLKEGFVGASMSTIAARVGGSKGTLYNYFPSKEDLFLACANRHCQALREQMSSLIAEGAGVRATLTRLGQRYVEVVASDTIVRRFRLMVAVAERAPEIAQKFYEMGPAQGVAVVAAYLEQAMRAGKLKRADARLAADQFLSLCYNNQWKARLLNAKEEPGAKAIARDVDAAVRVFLAAYGARA